MNCDYDQNEFILNPHDKELIQCFVCGDLFDIDAIELHVNICLDMSPVTGTTNIERNFSQEYYFYEDEYDPINKEEFECPICYCDVPVGGGYVFKDCKHRYCGSCLEAYYTTLIMDGKVADITCPDKECTYKVVYNDVRYILSEDMLTKYTEFLKIHTINSDPEMRWCPNPGGCGNAFKRQDKDNLLMACNKCNYEFCFNCSKQFHPGKTCEEADSFSLIEGAKNLRLKLWMKFNTKNCPRCKAPTQKRSGCNHMTCAHCRFEWCWQCEKEYTSTHYSSTSCTQYGKTPLHYYVRSAFSLKLIKRMLDMSSDSMWSSSSSSSSENLASKVANFFSGLFVSILIR